MHIFIETKKTSFSPKLQFLLILDETPDEEHKVCSYRTVTAELDPNSSEKPTLGGRTVKACSASNHYNLLGGSVRGLTEKRMLPHWEQQRPSLHTRARTHLAFRLELAYKFNSAVRLKEIAVMRRRVAQTRIKTQTCKHRWQHPPPLSLNWWF